MGTEFLTQAFFQPPAVGQAIDFEACVDLSDLPSGAVAAMYPYGQDIDSGQVITSDEIDFEYLGTLAPTRFLATAWDDFKRKGGVPLTRADGSQVTPYNNHINHYGEDKPMLTKTGGAIARDFWHCIKVRWLHTPSGFSEEWYTKKREEDEYQMVHQEQGVMTNRAMQLHLNIWVPQSGWQLAYNPALQPSMPGEDVRHYSMNVDWVKVSRVSGIQSGALQRVSPSTPVVSPPGGTGNSSAEPFSFNVSLTPYGPNTNASLTATPYIYQPEKYDLTYRFSVNNHVVQLGSNPMLNLATPGNGDHGDTVTVVVFATNKTTGERGVATQSATVVNTPPTANNVTASAQPGQEIIIPLSGSDIDGDPLTFQRTDGPTNGTGGIFLDTNGQYKMRYTSRSNFAGVETVRFVSKDSLDRTSNVATMTINVSSGNGA